MSSGNSENVRNRGGINDHDCETGIIDTMKQGLNNLNKFRK